MYQYKHWNHIKPLISKHFENHVRGPSMPFVGHGSRIFHAFVCVASLTTRAKVAYRGWDGRRIVMHLQKLQTPAYEVQRSRSIRMNLTKQLQSSTSCTKASRVVCLGRDNRLLTEYTESKLGRVNWRNMAKLNMMQYVMQDPSIDHVKPVPIFRSVFSKLCWIPRWTVQAFATIPWLGHCWGRKLLVEPGTTLQVQDWICLLVHQSK